MWLSGYRRTLEGTPFPYHGIAPDVRSALLVRGNAERPAVEWETQPLPAATAGDEVHLVWIFATAVTPEPVRFTLHVNDRPILTYENPRRYDPAGWTVEGEGGARLTFRPTLMDRHGDAMGFALLRLPAGLAAAGAPLRLRLESEDVGSPAWTMVYEHAVEEGVEVLALPRIRRADGDGVQWVQLVCTHLGDEQAVRVRHAGRDVAAGRLAFGRTALDVPVPSTDAPRDVTLEVVVGTDAPRRVAFRQEPIRRWTLYLVQHTHTDIGYTRPQDEILAEHLRFIDRALDLCDATDAMPDDARFRWTCEASWPVEAYLRSRPPAQVERLRRHVEEGRIELTALMFNLSELPDEAALLALLEPVRSIQEAGLPVRLAMQNDVNGLAWLLADALPALGVDRLVMGQHEHRAIACFERPTAFWWASPAGTRMLGWRGDHYMTGNMWGVHGTDDAAFGAALFRHLDDLASRGYPLDRVAIQYGGCVTDNAPPGLDGPATIERWNATWAWPRLRSATAGEFLAWVEATHGPDLGVHRAAWPDWWTDGFGSAARETAAARLAQDELVAVQTLAATAVLEGLGAPPDWHERIARAYEAVLFWGEHTLGAAESVSDPLGEGTQAQWGQKAAYAWDALRRARLLREVVLGWLDPALPASTAPGVVVLNPLGWERGGLVEVDLDHAVLPPNDAPRFTLPDGDEVAAQRLRRRPDATTWVLDVPRVPGLGHVALRVETGDAATDASAPPQGPVLENAWYRLELDPATGAVTSLEDLELGVDLVDGGAPWGLFAFVYERLGDRHQLERKTLETFERRPLEDVRIEPGAAGPVFQSLVVKGTLPGGTTPQGVRMEIRLLRARKHVQVLCSLRKLAVTEPEAVYVTFPFALPGGAIRFDVPGGDVVAGRDQLPGSVSDWNTAQTHVAVANEAVEVVVACREVPLWQLGGINVGRFAYQARPERPHVVSWVMNNYWVTNFRASQEGGFSWRYDLTSYAPGGRALARRFGWERKLPLVARVRSAGRQTSGTQEPHVPMGSLPPGVQWIGCRPGEEEHTVLLHLREVEGARTAVDVAALFDPDRVASIHEADPLGRPGRAVSGSLDLEPFGVRFVVVRLRP